MGPARVCRVTGSPLCLGRQSSPSCFDVVQQSTSGIVRSALDVKTWVAAPPSCAAVRPSHCPRCGRSGHPVGDRVRLHGHGLVERQQWGPPSPAAPPALLVLRVRRYRCTTCGAVSIVVPRGVRARHLYSAAAIALALALWAVAGRSQAETRRVVSPLRTVGACARYRWRSLARWTAHIAAGRLFASRWEHADTTRGTAAAIAMTLAAYGPPGDRTALVPHRAWHGGLHMA